MEQSSPTRDGLSFSRYYPWIAVLCAIMVRAIYYQQFQDNPFFSHVPDMWDQTTFYEGGRAFANGNMLALGPERLSNHFAPLYQYFLGVLIFLFGDNLQAIWIAQLSMGTLSTLLVYQIARQYFPPSAALAGALLFTFYGANWVYEGSLYRISLIVFLELASCWFLIRASQHPSSGRLAVSAVFLSLFVQARANNLLLLPFALVFLWNRIKRKKENRKRLMAGYLVLFLLVSAPGLVWVKAVHGHWGFYDQSGPENLLLSNTLDHSVRTYEHNETYRNALKTLPLETMPIVGHIARTALDQPLEFLNLYLKKTYYYFNNYEIPNTVNYYLFEEFSPVLKWASLPFAPIGVLGLIGLVLLGRKQGWTLLHSYSLAGFLMFLPFLVLSRYRLYTVPFLCIMGGGALGIFYQYMKDKRWTAMGAFAAGILVLALTFKTTPLPQGKIRINDYANMGSAYLNNQSPEDDNISYGFYKRAWDLSRSLEPAQRKPRKVRSLFETFYLIKAQKNLADGNPKLAQQVLQRAIEFNYASAKTHYLYALTLSQSGNPALLEALQALVLEPGATKTHLLLGSVYSQLKEHPYWFLYHWGLALQSMDGEQKESLTQSLRTIQKSLADVALRQAQGDMEAGDATPDFTDPGEGITQARSVLKNQLHPVTDFSYDLSLPETARDWSAGETERYLVSLYQHLTISPETTPGPIFYQLGVLYWKKTGSNPAALLYFEKAWEHGVRFPLLADLLNRLTEEQNTRPLPPIQNAG